MTANTDDYFQVGHTVRETGTGTLATVTAIEDGELEGQALWLHLDGEHYERRVPARYWEVVDRKSGRSVMHHS